jgi:AcrR family transcriptional regulator
MNKDPLIDHKNAERILEEGWQLFQQKGYRGVTVDEVCARCRLSKPTLYYYFRDKENLFVQILLHKLHGFRAAAEGPGNPGERMEGVAAVILASFQAAYAMLERDMQHIQKPENRKLVQEAFRGELFGPLANLMADGIAQGMLIDERPEVLTRIFLGIINNFIGKSGEMTTDTAALAKKLTTYFLNGVKQ